MIDEPTYNKIVKDAFSDFFKMIDEHPATKEAIELVKNGADDIAIYKHYEKNHNGCENPFNYQIVVDMNYGDYRITMDEVEEGPFEVVIYSDECYSNRAILLYRYVENKYLDNLSELDYDSYDVSAYEIDDRTEWVFRCQR